MKNIKAMRGSTLKGSQQGFTIIELVVVILLLGILTATALPRFIDVTDEARDAVKDATAGGLRTAMALYRAAVIAGDVSSGSAPTATSDYTLAANSYGYPHISGGSLGNCESVYAGLLQTGATTASATSGSTTSCTFALTEISRTLTLNVTDGSVN